MDRQKIINKHFSRAIMGYDIEEVDAFLDELVRDADRADQELSVARLRIRMLLGELQEHGLLKGRSFDTDGAEAVPSGGSGAEDEAPAAGGETPEAEAEAPETAEETPAAEETENAGEEAAKDE